MPWQKREEIIARPAAAAVVVTLGKSVSVKAEWGSGGSQENRGTLALKLVSNNTQSTSTGKFEMLVWLAKIPKAACQLRFLQTRVPIANFMSNFTFVKHQFSIVSNEDKRKLSEMRCNLIIFVGNVINAYGNYLLVNSFFFIQNLKQDIFQHTIYFLIN